MRLAVVVLALLAAAHRTAEACSCVDASPDQQRAWADLVFDGRAVEEQLGERAGRTRFVIDHVKKGEPDGDVWIDYTFDGAACGLEPFRIGATYRVFASRADDGTMSTGLCTGTHGLRGGWTRRTIATAVAILPGVVVHGAASWLKGDRRVGRRLFAAELVGFGLAAIAGATIGISGGAEEMMPALPFAIAGGGLISLSWFADVYNALELDRFANVPAPAPQLDAAAGYAFLGDPHSEVAHLATLDATARVRPGFASASAWLGNGGTWLARAELGARAGDGVDRAEVSLALDERHFVDDGFDTRALEVAARGRYDLGHVGMSLEGAFVTGELGYGHQRVRYRVDDAPADAGGLFLGRFGFGAYFGRNAEAEAYYDHRRDGLTGGLLLRVGANGFLGHVGVRAVAYRGRVGLDAGVEVGSAWLARLGVRFRL